MAYQRRRRQTNPTYIDAKVNANSEETQVNNATNKLNVYMQSLLELFARSNSILAGQTVNCVLSAETPIACTDGETVYFNPQVIKKALIGADSGKLNVKTSINQLARIRGVNLHELAHILYSPRKGQLPWNEVEKLQREINADSALSNKFIQVPAFRLWNLLEDLRIESLFSTQYRNSIPYFSKTVSEILLGDPTASAHMFHLWLYGRKYFSADVRSEARKVFIEMNNVSDVDIALWESLIDEYRSFVFPKDARRIAPLLLQFMELWVKYFPHNDLPESGTGPDNQGGHGERRNGGSPSASAQRDAQARREETEQEWEDAEADSDDGSSNDSDSDSDSDSDNGSDDDDADDDAGNSAGNSSGKEETPDSDSGDAGSAGSGTQSSDGPSTPSQPDDLLKRKLESELADSIGKTIEDSKETLKQVLYRADKLKTDALFKNVEEAVERVVPSPRFKAVSNALNTALRQLRSDNDSMWERGVPTGRLNIGLAIDSEAQETDANVFDRWNDSGDDAPRVELVILLDQSSSMRTQVPPHYSSGLKSVMEEASASMWAIKHACQQNEIPCTVVGYSAPHETRVLCRANDRVPNTAGIYTSKSFTDPSVALKIAHSIFSMSDATNKILVSISDGEWSITSEDINTIRAIHGLDVDSIFVALPSYYSHSKGDEPTFSINMEKGVHMGNDADGNVIRSGKNYEHRVCLKVASPTELAKKIGKAIVSASR
jgi:hypothetical protein